MAAGLVKGEGFAVDTGVMEANANGPQAPTVDLVYVSKPFGCICRA
jgi:hypothetical protein